MNLAKAALGDIPACAELYQNAFPEIITLLTGKSRLDPRMVEDGLKIIQEFEPEGFLVAVDHRQVVGLIMAVGDLNKFYRHVFFRGYPFRFLIRWWTGKYRGVRLVFLKRLWRVYRDYRHAEQPAPALPMGQILTIVVAHPQQGKGIGTTLLKKTMEYLQSTSCKAVRLEVDAENESAIHVYRKLGFEEQMRFRSPRGEALAMIKKF